VIDLSNDESILEYAPPKPPRRAKSHGIFVCRVLIGGLLVLVGFGIGFVSIAGRGRGPDAMGGVLSVGTIGVGTLIIVLSTYAFRRVPNRTYPR
jgi:hypothetical protein